MTVAWPHYQLVNESFLTLPLMGLGQIPIIQ